MATTKAFELGQLGSKLTIHSENITLDGNVHGQYAGFDSDFTVSIAGINSGSLSEGTNLYYTDARADARIAAADTGDLSEGSNLYYTDARADARVSLIVDAAPGTLNTLNELAAALGDDANFSTTVTNSIATKLPLAGGTMTGNIAHAGDFTIDAGGNITLDADGGSVFFKDAGTEFFKIRNTGSDVQIYSARSDADIKFEGVDGGVGITALRLDMSEGGRAYFANGFKVSDTQKAFFGDGNDLEIYHDGNNSYINDAGTGALLVRGSNVSIAKYTGETMINAFADGRVDLYYDNAIKLTTTTTGIDVTGTVTSDGLTVDGQAIIDGGTGVASTGVLHVRQNGNGEGNGIAITSSNATSHRIWKDANGKLNIGPASSPSAFVQDLNGNIGIGTDSPSSILHVTDGGAGLEVIPQTANDRTTLLSYDRNTSTYQTLDTDSLDMHFNLSGTERMRINTDGDISLASGGRFYFGGANRATSTNAQAYIKETGLNLDIKGNDNVRLLGDGGNVILHADYTGNVGIGTDSPTYRLDMESTATGLTHNLKLNKGSTTGDYAEIAFQLWNGANTGLNTFGSTGDSRPSVVLRAINEAGNTAAGAFVVGTFAGGGNNTTLTEKFRITSSGNVGIGTTSPSSPLHVSAVKNDGWLAQLINTGTGGDANGLDIHAGVDSSDYILRTREQDGTDVMAVKYGGKVGIGTTSPESTFHVNRSYSATERTMKINNGGNNAGAQYDTLVINQLDVPSVRLVETATNQELTLSVGNENSNSAVIGSTGQLIFATGRSASTIAYSDAGEAMRIDASGKVGIGTETPRSALQVVSGATRSTGGSARFGRRDITGGLFLHSDASTSSHYNWMITTQDTVDKGFEIIPSADPGGTVFSTPAFVITGDDRNVGIGTSSPGAKLDISSTGISTSPTVNITTTTSSAYTHAMNAFAPNLTTSQGNILVIGRAGSTNNSGYIGYKYSGTPGSDDNIVSLGHWGNNWLLNVKGNGNVGIGTESPADKLDVQGADNGITIRAITANRPVLSLINGSSAMLKISANGTYAAIGDGTDLNRYMGFNGGNVGIGTTSPNSKLTVNGTVHSVFGYSMRYIKTLNLTTSYQDIVAIGGGTPSNQGLLIAMSSENNYHQSWVITYSSNAINANYLGGSQGHTHSLDVQWRINNSHIQAKKTYNTGRPLTIFMVAGSMSADYD